MNGLLEDAIATCDQVMEMDASNSAARDYRSEILAMQQKYTSAKKFIESLYNTPQHSIPREKINNAMADVESILKTCIAWNEPKVFKAELLWALGHSEEAYQLTQKLVRKGVVENSSLHNLRAQIFVSMGRSEDAIRDLRMVLAHDHKNERAAKLFVTLRAFLDCKAAADMAYKNRQFDAALLQYEHAMTMCPSPAYMAKLFFNRACTEASLHRHEEAIHDCNEAIRLNEDYIKAYMRRAASLRMRETDKPQQCELAMRDYQAALSLCKTTAESREIAKKLKETRAELRELKREDISKVEKMIRRHTESSNSPKIGRNRSRTSSNPELYITRSRTSSMSSAYSSHDFGSPGSMTSSKPMYTGPLDFGPL
jgi:DnaJ family protein C protein 7